MKTLVILSQKGGAGKTTFSTALSVEAERKGLQTVIFDADPQSSLAKWAKRRESDTPFFVDVKPESIPEKISEAAEMGVDFCVVDTPPRADNIGLKCARLADLIVIPTGTGAYDLEAIEDSINIAVLSQKPHFVVVNKITPNAPQKFNRIKEFVSSTFGAEVFPYPISRRQVIEDCALNGFAPQELEQPHGDDSEKSDRALASKDFKLLFDFVRNHLQL